MSFFEKYDQVELSDGNIYLYIASIEVDGREYHFLSPRGKTNKFMLAEMIKKGNETILKRIEDRKIIEKIVKRFQDDENALK